MTREGFGQEEIILGLRAKEEPKVVTAEHGSVRLYCPKSDVYITSELHFPTIEDRDNFFASSPTEAALLKHKGSISFVTPNHLLDTTVLDEENDGVATRSSVSEIADSLGITSKELRTIYTLAKNTFLIKK